MKRNAYSLSHFVDRRKLPSLAILKVEGEKKLTKQKQNKKKHMELINVK